MLPQQGVCCWQEEGQVPLWHFLERTRGPLSCTAQRVSSACTGDVFAVCGEPSVRYIHAGMDRPERSYTSAMAADVWARSGILRWSAGHSQEKVGVRLACQALVMHMPAQRFCMKPKGAQTPQA